MKKPIPHLSQGEHASHALRLIGRFKWLRAKELGRMLHPGRSTNRKDAERYLRKLLALNLVVARPLPGNRPGKAYVLSERGARWMNDWAGHARYRPGTDWGTLRDGFWAPPDSWKHDLLAVGVLSYLGERNGFEVQCEHEPRMQADDAIKHPDGLLTDNTPTEKRPPFTYWLEVENTRKTGANMQKMVEALGLASRATPVVYYDSVQHAPVRMGMVAIHADAVDERGYKLNHLQRIEAALKKRGVARPLALMVAWMTLDSIQVGVDAVKLQPMVFDPATGSLAPYARKAKAPTAANSAGPSFIINHVQMGDDVDQV
jgi:hypothetical protein